MKPKNLEYSLKDISVPSKSSYLKSMMNKDENLIKRIRRKVHFFGNSSEIETYDMVRNIEFRNVRNYFQDKLKEDLNKIRSSKNLFVFADKSADPFEMSDIACNILFGSSITSSYTKCVIDVKHRIDKETKYS